jgi:hypothetical protein
MQVMTTKGLREGRQVEYRVVPFEGETSLTLAVEWREAGESSWETEKLIRRDVWVNMTRDLETVMTQGSDVNGSGG